MAKLYDLSKLAVLVVDDNKFMRQIVFQILHGLGIRQVAQAHNVDSALEVMTDSPTDFILSDLDMGAKSGLDLIKAIRQSDRPEMRMLPIVMVTGNATRKYVESARDAGVTEFIAKPLTAQSLYVRIVDVIERPRQFVKTKKYFGPDRRRKSDDSYDGPRRRADDRG
ncbi:MAG: response regulator [Alphaproteobacteria bacterium]|nr:response regulator [Alphaproteobacteria bacterium]